jgi:transcriptional regulator with XRE-family HTH domain
MEMGRQKVSMTTTARDAAAILGQQVQFARQDRGWTVDELGERAGVSYPTIRKIEKGEPSVSWGNVLNVAALVGVPLFGTDDPSELARIRARGQERLTLLPQRVRERKLPDVDLDF